MTHIWHEPGALPGPVVSTVIDTGDYLEELKIPGRTHKIFISYRRQDTQGYAGWLHQLLTERYGKSNVFRDVASIGPGEHFPTKIARTIEACSEVFVLIGPSWLLRDASGRLRLDDPDDWVRLEIEAALQRGVRIIPLLLEGATMPDRKVLPPSLGRLFEAQSFQIRDATFVEDVRRVIELSAQSIVTDLEFLGTEKKERVDRLSDLIHLYTARVERETVEVSSVPWRRAESLRPQFTSLIGNLEPDEDVADLALATLFDEKLKKSTTLLGLLASSPRRLIYVPGGEPSAVTAIRFRDIITIRTGLAATKLIIALNDRNLFFRNIKPRKRASEFVEYVQDRLER